MHGTFLKFVVYKKTNSFLSPSQLCIKLCFYITKNPCKPIGVWGCNRTKCENVIITSPDTYLHCTDV